MTGKVAVVIPPQPDGAVKAWRKLVREVKPGADSTFGIDGWFLTADVAYELPEGATVITCDQFQERRVITVMKAADSALEVIKAWETKGPLGKRACDWIRRRLAVEAASHRAVLIEEEPNRFEGRCMRCRNPVAIGAGHAWRDDETGRWKVYHRKGTCPPPSPPPQRVEPNYRGGPCFRCGGWVEAEAGAAILAFTPAAGEKPQYVPVHGGDCPPEIAAGPANQRKGWCGRCNEPLRPGEGCWQARDDDMSRMMLACHPGCRTDGPAFPVWFVRIHDGAARDGDVILARATPRSGREPVPASAPGYRQLPGEGGLVQFAAVVLDAIAGPYGGLRARVRVADWEEAAAVLAEDAAAVASAVPFEPGFRAQWTAEQYRDRKPWLARITGYDPKYGYEREFVHAARDWDSGSASRHRMNYCWTLRLNEVYEAWWPDGGKRSRRAFLRATPEGDVTEISEEEVTGWLALRVPPRVP